MATWSGLDGEAPANEATCDRPLAFRGIVPSSGFQGAIRGQRRAQDLPEPGPSSRPAFGREMIRFRVEWQDAPGVKDMVLARTWCRLTIEADGRLASVSILMTRTSSPTIRLRQLQPSYLHSRIQ